MKPEYDNPFDFVYDMYYKNSGFALHFSTQVVQVKKVKENTNRHRFNGTSHLYSGAILDYLAEDYKNDANNFLIKTSEKEIVILSEDTPKTYSKFILDLYKIQIPKWIKLLHKDYYENPKSQKALQDCVKNTQKTYNEQKKLYSKTNLLVLKLKYFLIPNKRAHYQKKIETVLNYRKGNKTD